LAYYYTASYILFPYTTLFRSIRQVRPDTKLIFLTREDSDAARFAAIEAGASAFIHKSQAAAEVVHAIRTVAAGGTLFTPRTIATDRKSTRLNSSHVRHSYAVF